MWTRSTALAGICLLAATTAAAQCGDAHDGVTVAATAEQVSKADVGYLTVFVTGTGLLGEDAESTVEGKVAEIVGELKGRSSDVSIEVQSLGIGSQASISWRGPDAESSARPEARRRIAVTGPADAALLTGLLDLALRKGATLDVPGSERFQGVVQSAIHYGLRDPESARAALERRAFDQAKAEASKLAELAGRRLGAARAVAEQRGTRAVWYGEDNALPDVGRGPLSTDPEAVELTVTLQVSFSFE